LENSISYFASSENIVERKTAINWRPMGIKVRLAVALK
jgi:hypothetical protein